MDIKFEYANNDCIEYLKNMDKHVQNNVLERKIINNEVMVVKDNDKVVGWLRFNYFWDNTPFMNMLWLEESYRGQGIGKAFVMHWERAMKKQKFELVMTSTLADESSQHFYRKIGYKDRGCLMLEGEALEIIFTKQLK